jgi:hypothetical protein
MSEDATGEQENAGQKNEDKKDANPAPGLSPKVERLIGWIGIYTLIMIVALTLFGIYTYYQKIDSLIKLLIYVSCAGGIGGAIYSAQGLTNHYIRRSFDPDYRYWYYARPILAIFMGVFSLGLITIGLVTFGGNSVDSAFIINANTTVSNSTSIPIPDFHQPLIFNKVLPFCTLAFLAGYSTTTLLKRMEAIAKTTFGDDSDPLGKDIANIKKDISQIKTELKTNKDKVTELEKAKHP